MTREEQKREAAKKTTGLFSYRNGYSTAEDAFVAGAEWADANQPNPWISVEEKLPEEGTAILEAYTLAVEYQGIKEEKECVVINKYYRGFTCDGKKRNIMGGTTCSTTHHWMEIPKLPKEEKK